MIHNYLCNFDEKGYLLGFAAADGQSGENIYTFDGSQILTGFTNAYHAVDGQLVRDEERFEVLSEIYKKENEIRVLKSQLTETDYIWNVIKEGDHDEEYYKDIIADRHAWRLRVRELEKEIEELKKKL